MWLNAGDYVELWAASSTVQDLVIYEIQNCYISVTLTTAGPGPKGDRATSATRLGQCLQPYDRRAPRRQRTKSVPAGGFAVEVTLADMGFTEVLHGMASAWPLADWAGFNVLAVLVGGSAITVNVQSTNAQSIQVAWMAYGVPIGSED